MDPLLDVYRDTADGLMGFSAQLSFGGVKESGAGLPEAGSSGIEFFTHHKVCYVKYR